MLVENSVLTGVETRRRHFHRDRNPHRVANALPERSGRAFYSWRFKKLRVTRCFRMQLPEAFDLRHRQIVTAQVEPGVKKHAAMPGRENEVIAPDPARLVGIVL